MAKKYKCPSGKLRYRDHAEAVRALHGAQNARNRAAQAGARSNRAERRDYRCPLCHGYHLTSQLLRLDELLIAAGVELAA